MRRILVVYATIIYLFTLLFWCDPTTTTEQIPTVIEPEIVQIQPVYEDIVPEPEPIPEPIPEPQPWWTEEELDMLAAVIHYEAGSDDCSDRHQQLVTQVVLNRVASNEFPNTVYDVVTQTKPNIQYSTYKKVLANMGNRDIISQRCYDNALVALNGDVDCPDNVVFQANFKQGSGIYEEHYTSYSVSYFCYR